MPATMTTEVSFKVQILRSKEKESAFHRFRGTYSFAEFQTVVQHLWGSAPRALTIEYEDDEGDRVRLSNESEWAEALLLWQSLQAQKPTPLRVFVRKAKKEKEDKKARGAAGNQQEAASESDDDTPATEANTSMFAEETLQSLQAPVIGLMNTLFECDVAKALFSGARDFEGFVRRQPNPFDPAEVSIDINQNAVLDFAVRQANSLMDAAQFDKAEAVLKGAISAFPGNAVLEYNLACAQSMQNKTEAAMSSLETAIRHGYSKMQYMMEDTDLENVRKLPEFIPRFADKLMSYFDKKQAADAEVAEIAAQAEATARFEAARREEAAARAKAEEEAAARAAEEEAERLFAEEEERARLEALRVEQERLAEEERRAAEEAERIKKLAQEAEEQRVEASRRRKVAEEEQKKAEEEAKKAAEEAEKATKLAETASKVNSVPPAVRQMIAVFPWLTVEDAQDALKKANGNMTVAMNRLLAA